MTWTRWLIVCLLLLAPAAPGQTAPPPNAVEGGPSTIYTDASTGVSFQYPSAWKQVRRTSGFNPPFAFSEANPATVIVEFTGEGNEYQGTTLESLDFLYGTVKATSADACQKLVDAAGFDEKKPMSQTIHGVTFMHSSGGEGSTGHFIHAEVYTTFRDDTCNIFEEDFTHSAPDMPGKRTLTRDEQDVLQRRLDRIMRSVTFASSTR
jgi:hypothetical protein